MTVRNSVEPCDAALRGHVTGKVQKAFKDKAVNHCLSCKIRLRINNKLRQRASGRNCITAKKHGEHNDELQQMNTLKVNRAVQPRALVSMLPRC